MLVFVGIGAIVAGRVVPAEHGGADEHRARRETEFDAVRQKFGGREPLLEMHDGVPRFTKARDQPSVNGATPSEPSTSSSGIPTKRRLARIALPFWLLRMKSDPIRFSTYASGLDDEGVDLRPEDIEKYGAGMILDTRTSAGERVLLWAQ